MLARKAKWKHHWGGVAGKGEPARLDQVPIYIAPGVCRKGGGLYPSYGLTVFTLAKVKYGTGVWRGCEHV